MKLLFCIKALDNPGGGAERVLAEVANGLSARGHDVSILTFDTPDGKSFYYLDDTVERIALGIGSTTTPSTLSELKQRISAIRKHLKGTPPDIAIGFMHSVYVALGCAAVGMPVPVIASEHIVAQHYKGKPAEYLSLLLASSLVKRFTCVSDQAGETFPWLMRRKMTTLHNPVAPPTGTAANTDGLPGTVKTLLSVGRLAPQKDYSTLIEAFAEVSGDFPDWKLRIVGEGELRPELEAQVEDLGLGEIIELAGAIDDISAEYQNAQLFVLPSLYESFGLSVVEALAHRLPVVGLADCPGVNMLVVPGSNGVLAEGGGSRSSNLAASLRSLMGDPKERASLAAGTMLSIENFSLENVLDDWEQLFAEVKK